jgi:hypothetical protein
MQYLASITPQIMEEDATDQLVQWMRDISLGHEFLSAALRITSTS